MAANYAEICRVEKLLTDLQQVLFVQMFSNFHSIVAKYKRLKIIKEKQRLFS